MSTLGQSEISESSGSAKSIGIFRKTRSGPWAIAASLLVATALYVLTNDIFTQDRYSTPVGGMASVPMADGSKVTLNTDSKIRVAVTDTERRVDLTQGEAFFEVAKDSKRPFIVAAGDKRIVAVGTKFSVRRDSGEIRVVVTEGAVRVETAGQITRMAAARLTPGTVAQTSESGTLLQKKPVAEAEEILSWRNGVLVFHEMTLAAAAAEFNRYNLRKIVIQDPHVASLRVAGNFRATNVDAFVRLLERGYPLRSEVHRGEVVLSAY